jgi:hypothetical protein
MSESRKPTYINGRAVAWVRDDLKLGHKCQNVLTILASRAGVESGDCFPGIESLADSTGFCESAVRNFIGELERLNLLTKERRQGPHGQLNSNRYHINVGHVPSEDLIRQVLGVKSTRETPITRRNAQRKADRDEQEAKDARLAAAFKVGAVNDADPEPVVPSLPGAQPSLQASAAVATTEHDLRYQVAQPALPGSKASATPQRVIIKSEDISCEELRLGLLSCEEVSPEDSTGASQKCQQVIQHQEEQPVEVVNAKQSAGVMHGASISVDPVPTGEPDGRNVDPNGAPDAKKQMQQVAGHDPSAIIASASCHGHRESEPARPDRDDVCWLSDDTWPKRRDGSPMTAPTACDLRIVDRGVRLTMAHAKRNPAPPEFLAWYTSQWGSPPASCRSPC